jgi:hypothetical protein
VLEPFPLVLEPMISCLTCIGLGRSRCLPKATRTDDSCINTASSNGRSERVIVRGSGPNCYVTSKATPLFGGTPLF